MRRQMKSSSSEAQTLTVAQKDVPALSSASRDRTRDAAACVRAILLADLRKRGLLYGGMHEYCQHPLVADLLPPQQLEYAGRWSEWTVLMTNGGAYWGQGLESFYKQEDLFWLFRQHFASLQVDVQRPDVVFWRRTYTSHCPDCGEPHMVPLHGQDCPQYAGQPIIELSLSSYSHRDKNSTPVFLCPTDKKGSRNTWDLLELTLQRCAELQTFMLCSKLEPFTMSTGKTPYTRYFDVREIWPYFDILATHVQNGNEKFYVPIARVVAMFTRPGFFEDEWVTCVQLQLHTGVAKYY